MYYASFGMLAIVVHIIINFEALRKPGDSTRKGVREKYRMFLFSVMLYYVSDILWGILYGARLIVPAYADTVLYFFSMVLSVLLWTRFVVEYLDDKGTFGRILIYSGWIIFIYEMIVLVINFFNPVVFGFDADNVYVPGSSRYITLFIQMFLFLMTSVYTLVTAVRKKGEEAYHHVTIGLSGIMMTVFIALQSIFPLMPLYAVGCLLATCLVHSFVYRDEIEESERAIEHEKQLAAIDPLTGVKNKHAYLDMLQDIERRVENGLLGEYGVIVFDLNDLKIVNDTRGHDAGDDYIRSACKMICGQFKHSPVFRIGGDEFVVILEGDDYEDRHTLLDGFDQEVDKNLKEGSVVIASGLDIYDGDSESTYSDVFRRADKKMYERKRQLKKPQ